MAVESVAKVTTPLTYCLLRDCGTFASFTGTLSPSLVRPDLVDEQRARRDHPSRAAPSQSRLKSAHPQAPHFAANRRPVSDRFPQMSKRVWITSAISLLLVLFFGSETRVGLRRRSGILGAP